MSAEKLYQQQFLPTAKYLLKELEYYGENQFKRKTEASTWTIGQFYHHLIQGTTDYHLSAIQECLSSTKENNKRGKTFLGFYVFLLNSFPPFVKLKRSGGDYQPTQIESVLKAKDMMFGFLKEMQKKATEIDAKNNTRSKVRHPYFGALNAKEWYTLSIIHLHHHLEQKNKIDEILRTFVKDEDYSDVER